MKRHNRRNLRLRCPRRYRSGSAPLEQVIILAGMLPLVLGALFVMVKVYAYIYNIVGALVGWPFL
jgi:hypothetical protein